MKEAKKRVKDTKKCVKEEINKEVDGERNFLKCEEPLVGEERRKRSRNFKKRYNGKNTYTKSVEKKRRKRSQKKEDPKNGLLEPVISRTYEF